MILNELDQTIEELLLQADDQEAQQLFDQSMRHSARMGLLRAMEVEVDCCVEKSIIQPKTRTFEELGVKKESPLSTTKNKISLDHESEQMKQHQKR